MRSEAFEQALARLEADRDLDFEATYAALAEAAQSGDAEATLLTGYATAAGYGCARDYTTALLCVLRAAELGEPRAQAQLDLLGGDKGDWREKAARVDLKGWGGGWGGHVANSDPLIAKAEGFITAPLCRWLIERARPLQEASMVYDSKTGRPVFDKTRTNSAATFKLIDLDLPIILLRQRIASVLDAPVEHLERSSVFRYEPGQTFADHADYIATAFTAELRERGQRPYTFIIYLNEAFTAGETHFTRIHKKLRCATGGALYWSNVGEDGLPDENTQHAGEPPTSGEKWLFSQFIRDKPQMPG